MAGERRRLVETHLARVVASLNSNRRLALKNYLAAVQSENPQVRGGGGSLGAGGFSMNQFAYSMQIHIENTLKHTARERAAGVEALHGSRTERSEAYTEPLPAY